MSKNIIKKNVSTKPISSDVRDALIKKALGYEVKEVTEEYSMVDKDLVLIKKKINTKVYPPDLDAIEMALSESGTDREYSNMSDDALVAEQIKLLEMFKKMKKE